MKIHKVAVGNSNEAFIESRFFDGVNIISSDDNNKGKTIVIQSLMYALGNEPTFPTSFDYKKYYYYVEFEVSGITHHICRSKNGFVLKKGETIFIFENTSELKRYWNKHIFPLPNIIKNQIQKIVDPVLFFQIFFVGQDQKDTYNIPSKYYNKDDFVEMLYEYVGLGEEELPQEKIDEIKDRINQLSDEKKSLLKQHKILKSEKISVSYLSAESDRLAFGKKIERLEKIQSKISELRKNRNTASVHKTKWENTINELRSLNRTISCGELRCMDCNSTNICFSMGKDVQTSYSFDVSTKEMRDDIIKSISEKVNDYEEEIERLSKDIQLEQIKLKNIMDDEDISVASIVAYKKDIFSASDAELKIGEIEEELSKLKTALVSNKISSSEIKQKRNDFFETIIKTMNDFYKRIDPDGNIVYSDLFTCKNEVYSGSEATVFHLVKLFSLQKILNHNFPIIVDSFRAEDLSTKKEKTILDISESIKNQIIFTTTIKDEEISKYDFIENINHINYQPNEPSKILRNSYVNEFQKLLSLLSLKIM